jgi:ferric-dicitrate binding protein FerR (iron transport regulator)
MTIPRYALLAARQLHRTDSAPAATALGADRERSLATIERALKARHPASRRGWMVGVAASVAAGVIAWLVVQDLAQRLSLAPARLVSVLASPLRDGASFLDSTGEVPLVASMMLIAGGRIATAPGGGARLQFSTGTRLELEGLTTLTLQSQDALQRFALAQGALDAKVAKLAPGERFVIDTPDAQVEVRGTEFHLQVLQASLPCGDGSRTRLDVTEGVVEVRSSRTLARVAAGRHWPSDCEELPSDAVPAASEAAGGHEGRRGSSASATRRETSDAASEPPGIRHRRLSRSLIAEQNAIFQRGVEAQRRGNIEQALTAYGELVERFPSSPLAENAAVARIRLSVGVDATRARREAASYLERYPRGFARLEAQRIAEKP